MYRILLVDDEMMELEALKNYIDWKALGIDHVDVAKNGKAAYELVLAQQPDIVITDIQMPVMDGIDLARKIYGWNRNIKIVFLTGYDEFEYLKTALQVGAVDYILKPFCEETIVKVINRVKEQIERDNLFQNSVDMMEKMLLQRLCTEEQTLEEVLLRELEQASERDDCGNFYGMVQFFHVFQKNLDRNMERKLAEIKTVWFEGSTLIFLIRGYVDLKDAALRIQKILEDLTGKRYNGVWLKKKTGREKLRESFHMLKSWENRVFYESAGYLASVIGFCDNPEGNLLDYEQKDVMRLQQKLAELDDLGQKEEISGLLDQTFSYFSQSKTRRSDVLQVLYRIFFRLEERAAIGGDLKPDEKERRESIYERIEKCYCIGQIREYINGILKQIEEALNQRSGGGKNAYVVNKVKEYVQKHYSEDMTVTDMAEEIHFSKNYIRTIFKEGTGQTILEYITNYRFERACELLKQPEYKVKDVSSKVGYENTSYFCSVFTKRFGITPNEYRRKYM